MHLIPILSEAGDNVVQELDARHVILTDTHLTFY